jgi:hypothetical protein
MKEKLLKGVAIATVSVISAALVAYLKNPENREAIKTKVLSAKKYAKKQARYVQYKLS